MARIKQKHLTKSIEKTSKLSLSDKQVLCDEIYLKQPNLLGSVLVQQQMGSSLEEVDVLLHILLVIHLSLEEANFGLEKITEEEQEHQLRTLSSIIKFSEGLDLSLLESSINQYIDQHNEKLLLAYVIEQMKNANFFTNQRKNLS